MPKQRTVYERQLVRVGPAPVAPEAGEAAALWQWAQYARGRYPELECLYAVPNGEYRPMATAARLKTHGVRAGIPDYVLPVPRGGYAALYLELKTVVNGALSPDQREWISRLTRYGNCAVVAHGFDAAKAALVAYLEEQDVTAAIARTEERVKQNRRRRYA